MRPGWLPDIPEAPENTNDSSGRGQPTASTLEPKVQRAGESVRAHRGLPADGRHDHRLALDQARRMACTDALMSAQAGLRTSWQGHSSMTNTAGLKRRGCGRPLRGGATRAVCTLQSVCWRYAVPRCVHTCSCLLRAVGDTLGSISHMDAEQLRAAAPGVPIWVREYRQLGANHENMWECTQDGAVEQEEEAIVIGADAEAHGEAAVDAEVEAGKANRSWCQKRNGRGTPDSPPLRQHHPLNSHRLSALGHQGASCK